MTEYPEECNEATTGVANMWSELLEFPDAVDGSMIGKFVSVHDGVTTTGEFGRLHCRLRTVRK